jgi:hypothetical protein
MALVKGTSSYATVAEADAYFEDRLDVAAWVSASSTQKAQALITATKFLDEFEWTGIAVSESQALAFPRIGTYFDPRIGYEIDLDSTTTPTRIVTATYELAYHLINNDGLLDDTGSVKSLSIGSINLQVVLPANKIPGNVKRIIKPLLVNSGTNPWWRAN